MSYRISAERAIDGRIWSSSALVDDLTSLVDEFGPRSSGTQEERRAGEWLVKRLVESGLENVHSEPFRYTGWDDAGTSLLARIGDRPPKPLAVVAHVYSPSTPSEGLDAPLVWVGKGRASQFQAVGERIRGSFVLYEATPWPIFWKGLEESSSPVRMAVEAGAAGVLLMGVTPGAGPRVGCCSRGKLGPIPCVGIGCEEGELLRRSLQRGSAVRIALHSRTETRPQVGLNVVGDIPAGEGDGPVVLLTAHYDGHRIGQGAQDNASGVATVLEVARVLVAMRDRLRCGIRILLVSAEELGLLGAEAYVAEHRLDLERASFVLNVDIAWPPFGLAIQASPDLAEAVRELNGRLGLGLHIHDALSLGSDHEPFVRAGVPAIDYEGALGPAEPPFPHTRADTFDKVDIEGMRRAASTIARVLCDLAGRERIPARRLSSEDLQQYLQAS